MILFRKLFAKSRSEQIDELIKQTETITMEVIKVLSMYWIIGDEDNDKGENVDHWLDKAVGYINTSLVIGGNSKDVFIYPHMAFIGVFDDDIVKELIGDSGLVDLRNNCGTPKNFIKGIINDRIKPKYRRMLGNNPDEYFWKVSEYQQAFKYMSLCLCGKIDTGYWNMKSMWLNSDIPAVSKIRYVKGKSAVDNIRETLMQCIKEILGVSE